jgi:hypothetical protein
MINNNMPPDDDSLWPVTESRGMINNNIPPDDDTLWPVTERVGE